MPDWHFYLLSHYICYGLMFLFSAFWLRKEWMQNSLWKEMEKRTEGRGLFWYCFRDAVKMISPAIIVYDKFTTILSQYIICSGDILLLRISASLHSVSVGAKPLSTDNVRPAGGYIRWGIDSPTDTDLLLTTYRGGSHLTSDIKVISLIFWKMIMHFFYCLFKERK